MVETNSAGVSEGEQPADDGLKAAPPHRKSPDRYLLALAWIGLLVSGGFATVIGLHDTLWAISLAAQILGLVFLCSGLAGLAGAALLLTSLKSWANVKRADWSP